MSESREWDASLYAESASCDAAGRLPYPEDLGARILCAARLGRECRALDVGCGPGSLTLVLAPQVGQIVGIDADPEMIAEAARQTSRTRIDNATWRHLRAEQLPADLGEFDLVTFAQSLHWMNRAVVLELVRAMVRPGGACVHVHASTARGDESSDPLPRPRPPYHDVETLVRSYLGSESCSRTRRTMVSSVSARGISRSTSGALTRTGAEEGAPPRLSSVAAAVAKQRSPRTTAASRQGSFATPRSRRSRSSPTR